MVNNEDLLPPLLEEVPATFSRLLKIWWSIAWRGSLFLLLLAAPIYFLGFESVYQIVKSLFEWTGALSYTRSLIFLAIFLGVLVIPYLFTCLLFKWIIDTQYKDFRLSFNPLPSPTGKKVFKVAWQYFMLVSLLTFADKIADKILLSLGLEEGVISFVLFLLEMWASIFLLSYVVNRAYGNVRLSLLKNETKINRA